MKTLDTLKRELLANPETRAEYEALAAEFEAMHGMAEKTQSVSENNPNESDRVTPM